MKGRTVAPKYRNPKNRSETWAGRGAMPRWMAAEIKAGKKREDFAIDNTASHWSDSVRPSARSDGHDSPGLIDELVPRHTASSTSSS